MTAGDLVLRPYTDADRPLLRQMVELYVHDFSELYEQDFTESGSMTLKADGYFLGEEVFQRNFVEVFAAFLIYYKGLLAGFALVDDKSQLDGRSGVHDVLQFFVLRGYRRHGVGRLAAHALFDRFPGDWEVRQIDQNQAAQAFWRKAIGSYGDKAYAEVRWQDDQDAGIVQRFSTPAGRVQHGAA